LIRNRLLGFSIAVVAAMGSMASISTAFASAELKGAGSTLVAPLMGNWINGFEAKTGIKVTYGSVGSGAGIAQITARTVDFGASDAPLTPEQAEKCNGCVQIPWALTGVTASFHINGVKKLKLDGSTLAKIYLGKITKWNDPKIRKLNKGTHLPGTPITVAFRSDGSGDTYAWTNYLSKVSKAWKNSVGYATAVQFPTGVGGKGNPGVRSIIETTNGAIGYISGAYALAAGLPVAAVKNKAGKFEYPNLKNIEAAAASVKHVPASNEMHIVDPPKKFKTAYPVSTFTYCIVPHDSSKKGELSQFILYNMTTGQKYGPVLDFAKMPKVVLSAAKRTLGSL
jgi:phosphate transport system substrate-binding protein